MTINLTDPIFTDETKAREHLEQIRWPDHVSCIHCGEAQKVYKLHGKKHRPGLFFCNSCEGSFTVTTGTVMESSHVPLNKWVLAYRLMASSKKGISAHQLHRTIGVTYKTAWFMAHRIRESMRIANPPVMGGPGKTIEADETYFGTKDGEKRGRGGRGKRAVMSLVERDGSSRSFHVTDMTADTLRGILDGHVSKLSHLRTDESRIYSTVGWHFASHETVKHSEDEYVRGTAHTNTVEGFFSVFKRGMKGVYQHCGEQHLQRYLDEFDFRYSNRIARGVDDIERTTRAIKGGEGKRLTYRPARSA